MQSQNTIMPGLSLVQWMNMQHNPSFNPNMQPDCMRLLTIPVIQDLGAGDHSMQFGLPTHLMQQNCIQFNAPRLPLHILLPHDQVAPVTTTKLELSLPSNKSFNFNSISTIASLSPLYCVRDHSFQLNEATQHASTCKSLWFVGLGGLGHTAVKFGKAVSMSR